MNIFWKGLVTARSTPKRQLVLYRSRMPLLSPPQALHWRLGKDRRWRASMRSLLWQNWHIFSVSMASENLTDTLLVGNVLTSAACREGAPDIHIKLYLDKNPWMYCTHVQTALVPRALAPKVTNGIDGWNFQPSICLEQREDIKS